MLNQIITCRNNLKVLSICQNWPAGPLPDQSVENEIGFSQEFLLENVLLCVHYLDFIDLTG